MLTTWINNKTVDKKWYVIDATDLVLGRLSAFLAIRLTGKHKSNYCPNIDCGDNFVIINAKNIKMTGNKLDQKIYFKHTGYPGGLKETSYKDILNSNKPEKLVQLAVKRMLPKGVLGREQFKKLHVYSSDKHPHDAQKPEIIDFKTLNRKNIVGKNYASK
ncbi:MAG: 50S ribosomal protein L13 [Rickettsiales bacterium]|nr:50S ribosomal protein L13 [Rickettsiales bacterium]OUV80300.1 MAG: 50S ribosomal protein L13 [Rickettsiales bacterium TMED131]